MDELIQALNDALDELGEGFKCAEFGAAQAIKHASEAVARAKILAEPQWGEPKENGPVWVEGEDGVWACRLKRYDGKWWVAKCATGDGYKVMFADWEPLDGRRVAPCVGRPRKAGG